MKGEHFGPCQRLSPKCLCMSCQRDGEDCCDKHSDEIDLVNEVRSGCYVVKCPHYLKEEETSNANT